MSRNFVFVAGLAMGLFWGAAAHRFFASGGDAWRRYEAVREFVAEQFVRPVPREKLDDLALKGMLAGLDSYSRFYDATETAEMARETEGRYRGIGIVLMRPLTEGRVLFTLPGSPAESGGLRVGDRVLEIDGRAFESLTEDEFRAELSKNTSEPAHLRVRGLDGAERVLQVVRESVLEPTVRREQIVDERLGVGYVAVHSFSNETAGEFDAAFERLVARGMRALVVDLRGNGGGVLKGAVAIARRFVAEGVVVSTEGRRKSDVYSADPALARHSGYPLVVLVDEDSASASEVLAGALQDHRVAVVVGAPTWGKGTVQSIASRPFERWGNAAKVTTSFYFTPSHKNLEHGEDAEFGIAPDVLVESDETESRQLHAYLARQAPPASALDALRAWEQQEKRTLIDTRPPDRALAAALGLFGGERPDGARPIVVR